MLKGISIIYANRNRDVMRIKASLDSLQMQSAKDLEVIFVDYGSDAILKEKYGALLKNYKFCKFLPLEVSHLLWNKSKALNYGIKKASLSFIFIADVDLIFHPYSLSLFKMIANQEKFFLFSLSYLDKKESQKLNGSYKFHDLKPDRIGKINGMILSSREALKNVNGLDEFFHFYGAEDVDLFSRLENAGYQREQREEKYFYHNWHQSFSGSEDKFLTGNPRIKNIMRINERHFLWNREMKVTKPIAQKGMAELVESKNSDALEQPTTSFRISNILAHVEHFLEEELASYKGEILKVEFFEDQYFRSLKYKIKKRLGIQTQPYISMKGINDMVLKQILFNYRDHNYSYEIGKDLKSIMFRIQL